MKDKNNINEIISKCTALYPPVLKEYMLLPANAFFRHNIKYTEKYLGEKEAERYRAYTEKIKTALTAVTDDADEMEYPCLFPMHCDRMYLYKYDQKKGDRT